MAASPALKGIGLMSWGSMNSFALTAIPLFILMAEIMQHSGLSFRIYRGLVQAGLRHPGRPAADQHRRLRAVRGDLRLARSRPRRRSAPWRCRSYQRGYHRPLSAGSLAAGGTLGILIPPSIAMIVYGTFTETSVSKLFMAGIVPGLLLTALFMAYVFVHALLRPEIAPREKGPQNIAEFAQRPGRPAALRPGDRRHDGQPLCRLGDADRSRRRRLRWSAFVVSAIWGRLGWAELRTAMISSVHDQRQHPADRLRRLRLLLRDQRGGVGES